MTANKNALFCPTQATRIQYILLPLRPRGSCRHWVTHSLDLLLLYHFSYCACTILRTQVVVRTVEPPRYSFPTGKSSHKSRVGRFYRRTRARHWVADVCMSMYLFTQQAQESRKVSLGKSIRRSCRRYERRAGCLFSCELCVGAPELTPLTCQEWKTRNNSTVTATCHRGAKDRSKAQSSKFDVGGREYRTRCPLCFLIRAAGSLPVTSKGPEYINEGFPLIDKFEKCTVQRILAGEEIPQAKTVEKIAPPEDVVAASAATKRLRPQLLASSSHHNDGMDADASGLLKSEHSLVMGGVFVAALVLATVLRGRGKNDAKSQ